MSDVSAPEAAPSTPKVTTRNLGEREENQMPTKRHTCNIKGSIPDLDDNYFLLSKMS